MLTRFSSSQLDSYLERQLEKWGGTHQRIDQWLNHRRALLVQYCKIAGLSPYDATRYQLPTPNEINSFCGLLVDYVSEGHFEIYDQLMADIGRQTAPQQKHADQLMARIVQSTDVALNFDEKYAEISSEEQLFLLDADLEHLMQSLAARFEQEDALLDILHQALSKHIGLQQRISFDELS